MISKPRRRAGALALVLMAWAVATAAAAQPFVQTAMFPLARSFGWSDVWPLDAPWLDCCLIAVVGSVLIALGSSVRRATM